MIWPANQDPFNFASRIFDTFRETKRKSLSKIMVYFLKNSCLGPPGKVRQRFCRDSEMKRLQKVKITVFSTFRTTNRKYCASTSPIDQRLSKIVDTLPGA